MEGAMLPLGTKKREPAHKCGCTKEAVENAELQGASVSGKPLGMHILGISLQRLTIR